MTDPEELVRQAFREATSNFIGRMPSEEELEETKQRLLQVPGVAGPFEYDEDDRTLRFCFTPPFEIKFSITVEDGGEAATP